MTVAPTQPCPYCRNAVGFNPDLAWKQVTCPHCQRPFEMQGDPNQLNWLDKQMAGASMVGIVLLLLCGTGFAVILGVVGLAVCRHPKARERAWAFTAIGTVFYLFAVGLIAVRILVIG